MNAILVTCLVVGCLSSLSDGVKFWNSRSPRSNNLWRTGWNIDTTTYKGSDSVSAIRNPDGANYNVNAITLSQGSYYLTGPQSGTEFYAAPITPRTCLTLSYKVWFEDGFDFAYGGKLPGLYGGGVDCTAGTDPGKDCFTSRFIWRTGGLSGINLYAPQTSQETSFCNSGDVECNQEWGHKVNLNNQYFLPNQWYTIQQTVRLNTPGLADGLMRINLLNVGLLYRADNVVFRNSADVNIDGIMFSNFFGGNSPCSASPKNQRVYFRAFQLKDNYC